MSNVPTTNYLEKTSPLEETLPRLRTSHGKLVLQNKKNGLKTVANAAAALA